MTGQRRNLTCHFFIFKIQLYQHTALFLCLCVANCCFHYNNRIESLQWMTCPIKSVTLTLQPFTVVYPPLTESGGADMCAWYDTSHYEVNHRTNQGALAGKLLHGNYMFKLEFPDNSSEPTNLLTLLLRPAVHTLGELFKLLRCSGSRALPSAIRLFPNESQAVLKQGVLFIHFLHSTANEQL